MKRRITRAHALIGAAALLCVLVVPLGAAGAVSSSGSPEATASASLKKKVKKLSKKVKNLQAQVDEDRSSPARKARKARRASPEGTARPTW